MLYNLYEWQHALLTPARFSAEITKSFYQNPWNPLSHTAYGRTVAAGAELFERTTRRFGRPIFGLEKTTIAGKSVTVTEEIITAKPFCNLLHFKRDTPRTDPKVLLVAPMSGHFATLLRGTVAALLPHHDVYITDWQDARQVPLEEGQFDLDGYVAYILDFAKELGPQTHMIAVCQPAVPVFMAVALMEARNDPNTPRSMTLMGGPIDPRISKTKVTELAENRPLSWFKNTVIHKVPFYHPGAYRDVYPGFIQLGGFMSMNLDRHVSSHLNFYRHLIAGDGESAAGHRKFYNEYLSVMDIPAEFYMQTVCAVFQRHLLPRGMMKWRDPKTEKLHDIKSEAIKKTALLTIEGELDDISARGQTIAAHDLCVNLPAKLQYHHYQKEVGHYGIFNGRRWRNNIMPRIRYFIRQHEKDADPVPKEDLKKVPVKKPDQWQPEIHSIAALQKKNKLKPGAGPATIATLIE